MSPPDPHQTSSEQNESPMAPPYVDEDDAIELTEMGMEVAENERRDAVTDAYESDALLGDEIEETLDDIAHPGGGTPANSPELSAMKEDTGPT